jgi:hypothetical protein
VKDEVLTQLREFKRRAQELRREVGDLTTERVSHGAQRAKAEALADTWVERLRSPLEHKLKLPGDAIAETSDLMKRLHVLSRPNNRRDSYLEVLGQLLGGFDNRFILPVQQMATEITSLMDLEKLVPGLSPEDSDYLAEAIACANAGRKRAAVVMGWCAAVARMQAVVMKVGFDKFNAASRALKAQASGRFKRWNKEFSITTLSELQAVFDTDLIVVLEGLGLLESNQADRLTNVCFQYRNHSAHPGEAPIEDPHVVAFFTDITIIVLKNEKFS